MGLYYYYLHHNIYRLLKDFHFVLFGIGTCWYWSLVVFLGKCLGFGYVDVLG